MPITYSGLTTGLLGYTLRKEFLGEGLYYRETEVFDYEIYAIPNLTGGALANPTADIQSLVKAAFNGYSGEVNVKVLEAPADYSFPNDSIRASKFNVQVEARRPGANLSTTNPELTGVYYEGLDETFFTSYGNLLNTFTEEFTLDHSDNGNKVFGHSVSFTLISGGKAKALEIASGIFSVDKDTTFGISTLVSAEIADTGNYINYFNETFDLVRNSFSFNKRREVFPITGVPYSYNLTHSMDSKEDGIMDITEKGNVQGRISFSQALEGFATLSNGIFSRCNDVYNAYKTVAGGTSVTNTLVNLPLTSSKVYNRPNLLIEYESTFTNNPNIVTGRLVSIDKTVDVEQTDGKYININYIYNFLSLRSPVFTDMDVEYITDLENAHAEAFAEVTPFYTSSPFFNPAWPNMNFIKRNLSTPNRKKNFSASIFYTNNPVYFVTLDAVQYPMLEYKVSDTKPVDIISEYKIINRPNKRSLINYAFQTERGVKSVVVTAKISRTQNVVTTPRSDLDDNILSLYRYAVGKLMETFFGLAVLSLTYYLSDVKYRVTSDNDLEVELAVTYAIKKYTA